MQDLNTFAAGDNDYIAKLNQDNAAVKAAIEALEALSGGASSLQAAVVPKGLKYIFDRKGIIGKTSYKPAAGTLTGPNYSLTIAQGGFWDGSALAYADSGNAVSMSAKNTGTYYVTVDASGLPSVYNTAGYGTVWKFDYNSSTHVVSNVSLYTGVAVLFDGADYADALTSAKFGLTFQSLADRLEDIESRLLEIGTFYDYDEAATSALDFGYKAGKVRNDNLVWDTSAGTVTLADDTTNYIEVNPADGTVSSNTTGFTAGQIPLYEVVTASGAITTLTDKRTWVAAGGGGDGGGSGHTQNTDTGTTSPTYKLNAAQTGAPSVNCELKVERGTSPDVGVRWNEATDKWQFTNDGTHYQNLFTSADVLAAQEFTKYVGFNDPPKVLESLTRSSSVGYETLDLSSYITASNGLGAVILRVFFWDSAPSGTVKALFQQYGGPAPAEAYTIWSNQYDSALIVLPIVTDFKVGYFVAASGANTANLKVYLVGYQEKVIGVGTVDKQTIQTGISVAGGSNMVTDIAGACNRGLVHYLKVTETGGLMTGTFNIEFFAEAACSTLLYQAKAISPGAAYEDWLPFWIRDIDGTSKLHVKITNNDTSHVGTFTVELHFEQFA